jgi:hypothetical protein
MSLNADWKQMNTVHDLTSCNGFQVSYVLPDTNVMAVRLPVYWRSKRNYSCKFSVMHLTFFVVAPRGTKHKFFRTFGVGIIRIQGGERKRKVTKLT